MRRKRASYGCQRLTVNYFIGRCGCAGRSQTVKNNQIENSMNDSKQRIYISGKITGLDHNVAADYFHQTALALEAAGQIPLNPMQLIPYNPEWKYEDYMAEDIRILLTCDAIFMLENWRDSRGARIEHAIAQEENMPIYYAKNHKFF